MTLKQQLIHGLLLAALPMVAAAQAGADCRPEATDSASLNACAIQRFQRADNQLNILYADVMQALSAHERPALRKAQTQWIRQRSLDCKARQAVNEGQADWPQRLHDCLTQTTEAHRPRLLHWLHHGQAPD